MVLGVIVSLLGIGMLVVLMFQMATFALPLFVGVTAGRFAFGTGAGVLGAVVVGAIAAAAALGVAQVVLVMTRSTALRVLVALTFAAPAAVAGYNVVLGLSRIGGAQGIWQPIFAGVGAVIVAGASLARLSAPLIPIQDREHTA